MTNTTASKANVHFDPFLSSPPDLSTPAPNFDVTIDSTNSPVDESNTLTVDATVKNAGAQQGTQTVTLSVDGTERDSQSESLDAGNSTQISLSWTPGGGDAGDYTATVESDNTSDSTSVTINSDSSSNNGDNNDSGNDDSDGNTPGTADNDDDDDNGGSGGGGGGGFLGSVPEPEVIEDPEQIENLEPPADMNPSRAEQATITTDEETGQARVTFTEESTTESITFTDNDVEGEVSVADYDTEPEETGASPGRSVAVTQIEVPDPDQSATIRKRIPNERLEEIGADAEDLRVNRFNEEAGGWQTLETDLVETTNDRVVVEAPVPGFSFFSVSAVSEPEATITAPGEVNVGEEFELDGSSSSDEYGEIESYDWRINGETLTGETVTTALESDGEAAIELTVTNDAGEIAAATATITVTEPDTKDGNQADDDSSTGSEDGGTETDSSLERGDGPEDQDGFGAVIALSALFTALTASVWLRQRDEDR